MTKLLPVKGCNVAMAMALIQKTPSYMGNLRGESREQIAKTK